MATYKEIQDFVKKKHGYIPKTCWIAHCKEVLGISVKMANNRISPEKRTHPCPEKKIGDIKEAFIYFKMMSSSNSE